MLWESKIRWNCFLNGWSYTLAVRFVCFLIKVRRPWYIFENSALRSSNNRVIFSSLMLESATHPMYTVLLRTLSFTSPARKPRAKSLKIAILGIDPFESRVSVPPLVTGLRINVPWASSSSMPESSSASRSRSSRRKAALYVWDC